MSKQLTATAFDAMTRGMSPKMGASQPRIIWTAESIGQRIGVSADFVRKTLVDVDGSPIKKIGTRYCAVEDDLIAFFRA